MSIPPRWHAGEDQGLGDCRVKGGPRRKRAASFPSSSPLTWLGIPTEGYSGMARNSHAAVSTGLLKERGERKDLRWPPPTHGRVCL